MYSKRTALWVLIGLTGLGILQGLYFYPRLPDIVAHHYNAFGQPDAWGSKQFLVSFQIGTILFIAVIFYGIGKLIYKTPDSYINLWNKSYWLAPERRMATLDKLSAMSFWLGNITLLFLLWLFQYQYTQNLMGRQHEMRYVWAGILVYIVILFGCIFLFWRAFRKKSSS